MSDHETDTTYKLPPELLANSALLQNDVIEEEKQDSTGIGESTVDATNKSPARRTVEDDAGEKENFVLDIDVQRELTHYQLVKREISCYMRDRQEIVERCRQKVLNAHGAVPQFTLSTHASTKKKQTCDDLVSSVTNRQSPLSKGTPTPFMGYPVKHEILTRPPKLPGNVTGTGIDGYEACGICRFEPPVGRTTLARKQKHTGTSDISVQLTKHNMLVPERSLHRVSTGKYARINSIILTTADNDRYSGSIKQKQQSEHDTEKKKFSLITPRRQTKEVDMKLAGESYVGPRMLDREASRSTNTAMELNRKISSDYRTCHGSSTVEKSRKTLMEIDQPPVRYENNIDSARRKMTLTMDTGSVSNHQSKRNLRKIFEV